MRELGYVEGRNLAIEYRYAENRPELLAVLAAELVQMKVDVIVIQGSPPTFAAQKATSTIPSVATVDARGHGRSTVPPPKYPQSMQGFARDLKGLLDHLAIDSTHFIGETAGRPSAVRTGA